MRSEDDVRHELITQAARHFGIEEGRLQPDDDLFESLGIDSMQALELITVLENHFDVELPDYEVAEVRDFRTLAAVIHERLA